ncbi:hypothetical protein ACJQWK_07910 [Exserohilum turcicum]
MSRPISQRGALLRGTAVCLGTVFLWRLLRSFPPFMRPPPSITILRTWTPSHRENARYPMRRVRLAIHLQVTPPAIVSRLGPTRLVCPLSTTAPLAPRAPRRFNTQPKYIAKTMGTNAR